MTESKTPCPRWAYRIADDTHQNEVKKATDERHPIPAEAFQVAIAVSADHLRSHHDTNVISNISQAGTADIIRRPRLWANNKDMKFDTY